MSDNNNPLFNQSLERAWPFFAALEQRGAP